MTNKDEANVDISYDDPALEQYMQNKVPLEDLLANLAVEKEANYTRKRESFLNRKAAADELIALGVSNESAYLLAHVQYWEEELYLSESSLKKQEK